MISKDRLRIGTRGHVRWISFDAPERRNALTRATLERFQEAVLAAASDDCRAVVLTGTGDAFCSGADLQDTGFVTADEDVTAFLRRVVNPAVLALRAMAKPVIARVHGPAAGMGCGMALAADIRIASSAATFSQAFVKIALMPDGGNSWFVPRAMGYAHAFEWMLTGETLTAAQAFSLGLVNRVLPFEELDGALTQLLHGIVEGPLEAIGSMKQALAASEMAGLAEALEREAVLQQKCFDSEDFREGVRAFREKRRPRFGARQ